MIEHGVDLFFLTETWLNENDAPVFGEMTPPGYSYMNFPRGTTDHGGLAIIHKSSMHFQIVNLHEQRFVNFEHISIIDIANDVQYILIYRPPPSPENGLKLANYLKEFDEFMSEVALMPRKVILLGDFNIHADMPHKSEVRRFLTSVETTGFFQHVVGPTHRSGHTLDLVMSRLDDNLIGYCTVYLIPPSDHDMVKFCINLKKPSIMRKQLKSGTIRPLITLNLKMTFLLKWTFYVVTNHLLWIHWLMHLM
jgi:hypothetical protein